MRYAIVFTTINVPTVLEAIYANLREFDHLKDTEVIVVADHKTPNEAREYAERIGERDGFNVLYLGVEEQLEWLKGDLMRLGGIIPWNSDNRRNVGYLKAVERGAEVVISIDDDNWPMLGADFIGGHSVVGGIHRVPNIFSPNGWVNPCLTFSDIGIYPRGFPYSKRQTDAFEWRDEVNGRVVVNEGLWFGDPDVDATTRLHHPSQVSDDMRLLADRIGLAQGMMAPLNSQNTAFHKDVLPCFFFVPMGFRYGDLTVDRFGDIWMGFFAQKVIAKVGGVVCFGQPIVRHERNQHDLFKDLMQELGGMILTERLVDYLEDISLSGESYGDAYVELGAKLYGRMGDWDVFPSVRQYFRQLKDNMAIWVEACGKVMR